MSWPPVITSMFLHMQALWLQVFVQFDQPGWYRLQYQFAEPRKRAVWRTVRGVGRICSFTWTFRQPTSVSPTSPVKTDWPCFLLPLLPVGTKFYFRLQENVVVGTAWVWVVRSPVFTVIIPT
jgi:hypothetical protein